MGDAKRPAEPVEVEPARTAWQRAQAEQAARHAAPVCPRCGVQFAVCGCEPEGEAR